MQLTNTQAILAYGVALPTIMITSAINQIIATAWFSALFAIAIITTITEKT